MSMTKDQVTFDQVTTLLQEWYVAEMSGTTDDMKGMLEDMDEDIILEINQNIAAGIPTPEAIYDVLMEDGALEDDDDIRNSFVDFYEKTLS